MRDFTFVLFAIIIEKLQTAWGGAHGNVKFTDKCSFTRSLADNRIEVTEGVRRAKLNNRRIWEG
jgi:DNA topoisomerase IB